MLLSEQKPSKLLFYRSLFHQLIIQVLYSISIYIIVQQVVLII